MQKRKNQGERKNKMVKKLKACKRCRFINDGEKCPKCGSASTDSWKGKIEVFSPEKSEIAKNLKLMEKGTYAVKSE
jgi:RNA polymerase subunit RPABC4/transcription elongation factor Spt4